MFLLKFPQSIVKSSITFIYLSFEIFHRNKPKKQLKIYISVLFKFNSHFFKCYKDVLCPITVKKQTISPFLPQKLICLSKMVMNQNGELFQSR